MMWNKSIYRLSFRTHGHLPFAGRLHLAHDDADRHTLVVIIAQNLDPQAPSPPPRPTLLVPPTTVGAQEPRVLPRPAPR